MSSTNPILVYRSEITKKPLSDLIFSIQQACASSWLEELSARLYFPFYPVNDKGPIIPSKETPRLEYGPNSKPAVQQLLDILGEEAALENWFSYADREAINELFQPCPISGEDSVSLFELSLMIGERILGNSISLLSVSWQDWAGFLITGSVEPRHPMTLLRWREHPFDIPNLTWRLYPKEVQDFALSRWGQGVYTEEELKGRVEDSQQEKPLHESERKNLLRIIKVLASMAELILDQPYKAAFALEKHAASAGLTLPGADTIGDKLKEAKKID